MKLTRPIIILAGGILVLVALVGSYALTMKTNCGGNSAALFVCHTCMMSLRMAAPDVEEAKFVSDNLSKSNRVEIATNGQSHWINDAKFFIRKNFVFSSNPKQIVVVCDHAYDNIPQPTIWNGHRKNPAHAVGYSDGSTGLITPAQFASLSLSEFTDASRLRTEAVTATNPP